MPFNPRRFEAKKFAISDSDADSDSERPEVGGAQREVPRAELENAENTQSVTATHLPMDVATSHNPEAGYGTTRTAGSAANDAMRRLAESAEAPAAADTGSGPTATESTAPEPVSTDNLDDDVREKQTRSDIGGPLGPSADSADGQAPGDDVHALPSESPEGTQDELPPTATPEATSPVCVAKQNEMPVIPPATESEAVIGATGSQKAACDLLPNASAWIEQRDGRETGTAAGHGNSAIETSSQSRPDPVPAEDHIAGNNSISTTRDGTLQTETCNRPALQQLVEVPRSDVTAHRARPVASASRSPPKNRGTIFDRLYVSGVSTMKAKEAAHARQMHDAEQRELLDTASELTFKPKTCENPTLQVHSRFRNGRPIEAHDNQWRDEEQKRLELHAARRAFVSRSPGHS